MADEQAPGMNHDALVRRTLGDPAAARAWLQARLPEDPNTSTSPRCNTCRARSSTKP